MIQSILLLTPAPSNISEQIKQNSCISRGVSHLVSTLATSCWPVSVGWRKILSREFPFNILNCVVTFPINRCHNKGMPLLPSHSSTVVNHPQDRRHPKLWHEYPRTHLLFPTSVMGGRCLGGFPSKNPWGHLTTRAKLKERKISFEMKITECFFSKNETKLNFFLHYWQLQCRSLVWGREIPAASEGEWAKWSPQGEKKGKKILNV